jgi:xanthine dehydrogenase iron-sulfur cluster and FAD-binding subunit A
MVVRCVHAEAAVRGLRLDRGVLDAARLAISRDISPIDDMRSTADYRMRVAQNLLIQFLSELTS